MMMFDFCVQKGNVHGLADEDQKTLHVANRNQIAYDLVPTATTRRTLLNSNPGQRKHVTPPRLNERLDCRERVEKPI